MRGAEFLSGGGVTFHLIKVQNECSLSSKSIADLDLLMLSCEILHISSLKTSSH